jgi:hypothetical protein
MHGGFLLLEKRNVGLFARQAIQAAGTEEGRGPSNPPEVLLPGEPALTAKGVAETQRRQCPLVTKRKEPLV